MKLDLPKETVSFSVKGQVVIPRRFRRAFEIEEGTRAWVEATPEGILIRPITAATIRRLRGILRRKPDAMPLAEELADHQLKEKELEQTRYGCLTRP